MAAIDAILFDIGNVLVEWDPRHLYRQLLPDNAAVDAFLSQVCTPEWHFAHDQGVSFEENAQPLKEKFPDHGDLIDQWRLRYLDMVPAEVAGMADLMAKAKAAGLGTHGLTNMPRNVFGPLSERFALLGHLETVTVSGDERICKPDPRIYELALARMGTGRDRTLFVDDTLANAQAAERLGFQTHHFASSEALSDHLRDLGLERLE